MGRHKELRVLVATDGSGHAQAALTTTVHFPWPARTRVRVVTARRTRAEHRRSILLSALDRGAEMAGESARRALSRRWPDVEVEIVDQTPVEGILSEADRFEADVIVLGWRGHGAIRRLLMGSVSRGVVRRAKCNVLVVRGRQRIRKIVVGFDGSPAAKRALAFVGRLAAPSGGQVTLVGVVESTMVPSGLLVPGAAAIAYEVKRTNAIRVRATMKELKSAVAGLVGSEWRARTSLVQGEPLRELLSGVAATHAQLLVVGARSTSGVRRLLLGSVAEGALNRCPVGVLVVR